MKHIKLTIKQSMRPVSELQSTAYSVVSLIKNTDLEAAVNSFYSIILLKNNWYVLCMLQ